MVVYFFCSNTKAQNPINKAVADAFLIIRMVEKFHVQPKPLDDVFSASMFHLILKKLDAQRIYFTQQDITALQPSILQLDNGDDDGKVKSFIIKGTKSIGYISLPAFYEDWENRKIGANGCANDEAKKVLKLKKENINGLVIDVRYNGGGPLNEAIDLAGIFIDAGQVGLIKDKTSKLCTLKDVNRGTIYDGQLAILVNGYSASASEVLANTLQDYNRVLIVGALTYGKAAAQVVLPMDTTI
jgi:carboxyl-terminal processing protease